jgi:heat-inducible transcriptional repressor
LKPPAYNRRQNVFRAVVREYLRSADPVGSETIVTKYHFGVSPATIRNDMADLEEQGLLEQPHTSSGRVPTEAGYRYYVEQFVPDAELEERRRRPLETAVTELENDMEAAARKFARTVADLTGETALVRIGAQAHLTGVSNMLDKPEFREGDIIRTAMRVMDELDVLADDLERQAQDEVAVLIGSENPLGRELSSVITVFAVPNVGEAVIGILGPRRMDYDANVALLRYVRERLDELEE